MGIIKRQTILSSVFAYAGTGVGFVTQGLLFPKLLTQEQVGLVGLLLAWSVGLAQFANLGLNGAGNRYFPYFRDHDRQHNGYLLLSLLTTFTGVLLCSALLVAFRPLMVERNLEKSALFVDYYFWLIPLTLFTVAFNVFDNYAKLLYDSVPGSLYQLFINRLVILVAIIAYWFNWLSFHQFMVGWMVAFLTPAVLMGIRVAQKHGFSVRSRYLSVKPELRRQVFRYATLSWLTALSANAIQIIGSIMVNDTAGLKSTGIYTIMVYFGSVIALPAASLYKVAGTIIADAWKRNDTAHIADVYARSCLNQLIIGMLVFVGIAANLPNVFQWLPAGYEAGYYVVLWIGLGKLIDMATGVNGVILATSRYYAYDSAFFIALIVITIGVNAWLIPRYGINGAAVGAAFVTALYNFVRTVFVWVAFGMQPFSGRFVVVILIGLAVWWLAVQYPYGNGTVRVMADVVLRSGLITLLFGGLVIGLKLSPDLNQTVTGLLKPFAKANWNKIIMRLFRFLFKDLFRSLETPGGRQFLWLLLRYADRPRNQPFQAKVGPFRFRVIDGLSFAWQYKEIFTDEFYRFQTTEATPVIYDCGANIGMSVAYFRQQYPTARIVAFEADPAVGAILAENLATNSIQNVEVIHKAVWTNGDGVDFGSGEADAGSMYSTESQQRVPSVRLRDYLLREPRIDMLKMDIEGAEADVLADCHDALGHVQNLFIEYHSYVGHGQALAGILTLLETNGFRYYIDTNQHRTRPFLTRRYKGNDVMDLQLNVFAYRV